MKKLLKKVNFDTTAFLVFMMVSVLTFSFSIGFYLNGDRPISFFSKIEGKVISVIDYGTFTPKINRSSSTYICTKIQLDTLDHLLINLNTNLSKFFYIGQKVNFLVYENDGYYFFVEATEGDKVLVKYNERKGNIVFAIMIISGILTLFCAYIRLFYKKEKSKN